MRPTTVASATRRVVRDVPKILPPIPLYRRVLRAHYRHLDPESRKLGDDYVKEEFKLHRRLENPLHIVGFLSSWQSYAEQLEGNTWREAKLDTKKLQAMSEDQIVQLYELMLAARDQPSEQSEPQNSSSP